MLIHHQGKHIHGCFNSALFLAIRRHATSFKGTRIEWLTHESDLKRSLLPSSQARENESLPCFNWLIGREAVFSRGYGCRLFQQDNLRLCLARSPAFECRVCYAAEAVIYSRSGSYNARRCASPEPCHHVRRSTGVRPLRKNTGGL